MPDHYYTIENSSIAEFKDRGSKFIAYACPVADISSFKEKHQFVKKEHPKASHYCFAYRIGAEGDIFRVADDGEPSGSAGRPILGQIDSKQLTNTLIIVVRYFGGSLLGIPGLINAYKTSAAFALELAIIVKKPVLIAYRLQFDYTQMNEVMKTVKQFDCHVFSHESGLYCSMGIGIPKDRLRAILKKFEEVRGLELELR
jgi:uncharacterized YigZ family protein